MQRGQLSKWTHIALAYDSATQMVRIFLNGECLKEASLPLDFTDTYKIKEMSWYFGAAPIPTRGSKSYLSDCRMWGVAKTDEEIKALMKQPVFGDSETADTKGLSSGLLGSWPLNEGMGRYAADESPFHHYGILLGCTWRPMERPFTRPAPAITVQPVDTEAKSSEDGAAEEDVCIPFAFSPTMLFSRAKGVSNGDNLMLVLNMSDAYSGPWCYNLSLVFIFSLHTGKLLLSNIVPSTTCGLGEAACIAEPTALWSVMSSASGSFSAGKFALTPPRSFPGWYSELREQSEETETLQSVLGPLTQDLYTHESTEAEETEDDASSFDDPLDKPFSFQGTDAPVEDNADDMVATPVIIATVGALLDRMTTHALEVLRNPPKQQEQSASISLFKQQAPAGLPGSSTWAMPLAVDLSPSLFSILRRLLNRLRHALSTTTSDEFTVEVKGKAKVVPLAALDLSMLMTMLKILHTNVTYLVKLNVSPKVGGLFTGEGKLY